MKMKMKMKLSGNMKSSTSASTSRRIPVQVQVQVQVGFLSLFWLILVSTSVAQQVLPTPPTLDGRHFKITVVEEEGFVDFDDNHNDIDNHTDIDIDIDIGRVSGGYCIDILAAIAKPNRANFTYELRSPSGMGNLCMHKNHQVKDDNMDILMNNTKTSIKAYSREHRAQYLCGQSDVIDQNLRGSEYATDMYLGLFYVTPERLQLNLFTMSFHPPTTGALTLFGIATRISSVEDLIQQQQQGLQKPVCVQGNTAFSEYIRQSLAALQTKPFDPSDSSSTSDAFYDSLSSGECDIHISDNPVATQFILNRRRMNQCNARGQVRVRIETLLVFLMFVRRTSSSK
jgi:ABC-type amino acid transport substrate-binding protein